MGTVRAFLLLPFLAVALGASPLALLGKDPAQAWAAAQGDSSPEGIMTRAFFLRFGLAGEKNPKEALALLGELWRIKGNKEAGNVLAFFAYWKREPELLVPPDPDRGCGAFLVGYAHLGAPFMVPNPQKARSLLEKAESSSSVCAPLAKGLLGWLSLISGKRDEAKGRAARDPVGPFGAAVRGKLGACQDPYLRFWAESGFGGAVNLVWGECLAKEGKRVEAYAHTLLGVEGSLLRTLVGLHELEKKLSTGERRRAEALAREIWNRRPEP